MVLTRNGRNNLRTSLACARLTDSKLPQFLLFGQSAGTDHYKDIQTYQTTSDYISKEPSQQVKSSG